MLIIKNIPLLKMNIDFDSVGQLVNKLVLLCHIGKNLNFLIFVQLNKLININLYDCQKGISVVSQIIAGLIFGAVHIYL